MILRNANNQAEYALQTADAPFVKLWPAFAIAIGLAAFAFYKYLLYYYHSGDPLWYQMYYDSLLGQSIPTALISQKKYIGSSELIYPLIAWTGSNLEIERNTLMAVFDGLLYFTIVGALIKRKCSPIYIALATTNFYLLVLCTSAERLKFSYIFLFLALLSSKKYKPVWAALAPLTHFQTIITGASITIFSVFDKTSLKTKISIVLITLLGAGAMMYLFSGAILEKFAAYNDNATPSDAIPSIAILLVSLAVFKNKSSAAMALTPLVVLAAILGGERINMISFTVFSYIVLLEKKTNNPIVLLIMIYFSYKSIGFVQNVIAYGNGFAMG